MAIVEWRTHIKAHVYTRKELLKLEKYLQAHRETRMYARIHVRKELLQSQVCM